MKRDLNCNHIHCGCSPLLKPMAKIRYEESHVSDYGEEFCKDCSKEHQRLLYSDLHRENPSNVSVKNDGKPIHNKENQQVLWKHSGSANRMDGLETSMAKEDSGYSSMLGNQHDSTDYDDSVLLAGNLTHTPNHHFIQDQCQIQCPKKNLLPALHFEELVCSTLKKNGKRNPKSWAFLLDKMVCKESMGLTNLIGRKMGIDRLDILGELFHRQFRHLLANILRHLSDMELINVAKVSTTWKKILLDDKGAFQKYNTALKLFSNNNAKSCKQADTREYSLQRDALALVQKVATAQNNSSKTTFTMKATNRSVQSSSFSRHAQFSEVAKTLKNSESLKVCHCCGFPAKYDSHLQRARCVREGCSFDFCTKCLCSYHSATDCTSGKSGKPVSKLGTLPGTKKSKQNLRRL